MKNYKKNIIKTKWADNLDEYKKRLIESRDYNIRVDEYISKIYEESKKYPVKWKYEKHKE